MEPRYQDEIDWRDLLRQPSKLFGYAFVYFLAALIGLGLLYLGSINAAGTNAVDPQLVKDSSSFVIDIPLQSPRVLPPVDVARAAVPTPEMAAKGRDLYKANCASCHGDNGQGDGPTAPTLNPKPRNFHSLDGWKNGSKVTQIYKTLQEGIAGGGMASYNYMPPEDRFALIHHVRGFAPGQPLDSPDELKALDAAYELAKGMNIAGQIPVKRAAQAVVKENAVFEARVRAAAAAAALGEGEGAEVFRRVASDGEKAVTGVLHGGAPMEDLDRFVTTVSNDPARMGFRGGVTRLTPAEWSSLHAHLIDAVKEEQPW
jgi:mono/diheme cytochrome c family protein